MNTTTQGTVTNDGIVNFDPNTGKRLSAGQSVQVAPGGNTYGSTSIINGVKTPNNPVTNYTPTPVVSSSLATNLINNKVTPIISTGNNQIATAAQTAEQKRLADQVALSKIPKVTPDVPLTPEQQIANEGMKAVYDKATGEKSMVPKDAPILPTRVGDVKA